MFDQFKIRAEAVSAVVHRVADRAAGLAKIAELMKEEGVADAPGARAVWAACPILDGMDKDKLAAETPGLGFSFGKDEAADARVGVTQADYALANTGTLVQDSTDVTQRLASSLVFTHIAVVEGGASRLLPDLPTLLAKLTPEQSAYITLITGPSRTADIERVLTIGVHGPEKLHIVWIEGQAEGGAC